MTRWIALCLTMLAPLAHALHINDPRSITVPNTRFSSFSSAPKSLDPARSYSANELVFIGPIYEPPLQIAYLDRPYRLIPLTATRMPTITYLNDKKQPINKAGSQKIAYTKYTLTIRSDIRYQPHWAFNPKANRTSVEKQNQTSQPTRTLTAADYVYEIKRLASPRVNSPIYSLMGHYIVGLKHLHANLVAAQKNHPSTWLDLRPYTLSGVKLINDHTFSILIHGNYPPFIYWLSMPFFSPIPWEADRLYAQPNMKAHNLTFDWLPIGTGPYYLKENNPQARMVLAKNPNFHQENYPSHGEAGDADKGYLTQAGKQLPFIDEVIYQLEKESIPLWNKFLQGYYDNAGVSPDSFDQAIQILPNGSTDLTPSMKKQHIRFQSAVDLSLFYMGFNMLDPVVGGYSDKKRALRHAIAIAVNYEEYITIFLNGRGIPAQSPIPPGIFGYQKDHAGMNPYVYTWMHHALERKSIAAAKQLLAKAGYPNGIDPKTHKPLLLHYDAAGSGDPAIKAQYAWFRKQFAKLGIRLDVRSTLYNRFRDKVRTGQAQLFSWGWLADFPDPENFLFILTSSSGKVLHGGENATNYSNSQFDALFKKITVTPNGPKRQRLINQALLILQKDAPMLWGFHSITYSLSHHWNSPIKPNPIIHNTLKYLSIDATQRQKNIDAWNQPVAWPIGLFLMLLLIIGGSLYGMYRHRDRSLMTKRYTTKHIPKDDS